jgi:hypothetical protein
MTITKEQLEAAITSGNFDALVGTSETAWLECKGQPYLIDNDEAKRELAKDASAFANASGGRILIGVRTKSSATHFGDEIEEIRPFLQGLVNVTRYINVLESWVYPVISGLTIVWVPTHTDATKGVVVVTVPPQSPSSKPYLVTRTYDGAKHSETLLGYAERKGDTNKPLGAAELHSALRAGLNYDSLVSARFDALEALVKIPPPNPQVEQKLSESIVEEREKITTSFEGIAKQRCLILSAVPTPPGSLKTVFVSSEGSIRRQLENPPSLRSHGWDLSHYHYAKIVGGQFLRVSDGARKVLDLYRDGTMIAAALTDRRFLGWDRPGKERIHPLALIEFTYLFLKLYSAVVQDFSSPPSTVTLRVGLRNMHLDGSETTLAPYGHNTTDQQLGLHAQPAPTDDAYLNIEVKIEKFDPLTVLFDVVREIYLWFGIEENKIPYFLEESGRKKFDADRVSKIS